MCPKVTIIVVTYNSENCIGGLLEDLLKTKYDNFEVVIVDNNSVDRTKAIIRKLVNHRIKVYFNDRNYGYAGAIIRVWPKNSKYVVILNPDVRIPDDKWLIKFIRILENNKNIGAAQPILIKLDGDIWSAGGRLDILGYPHGVYNIESTKTTYSTFFASGAFLIIRNEAYIKVGGFYPNYFLYYDETDLCWRFWKAGYKVVVVPHIIAIHMGGASVKTLREKDLLIMYLSERNRLVILYRNYSIRETGFLLLSVLILTGSIVKMLVLKRYEYVAVKTRALIDALIMMKHTNRSKAPNTSLLKVGIIINISLIHIINDLWEDFKELIARIPRH